MAKRVLVRLDGLGVYDTLEQASEALGMSVANISRAVSERRKVNGVALKWAERVYAVREKDGDWIIGVLNSRNSAFLPVSQIGGKVDAKRVIEKKDITACWYGMDFAAMRGDRKLEKE